MFTCSKVDVECKKRHPKNEKMRPGKYRGLRDYCATGLVLAGGHAAEDEGGRMHRDEEVKEVEGRDCGVLVHMFPPLRMNED